MILVTGGTGFVGSGVVRELAQRGNPVGALGRDRAKVARRFTNLQVTARAGDVRNVESLREAFKGIDVVINAVQFPNSPIENKRKGYTFEKIDYEGTLNQIAAAKDAGVQRFIYVSGVGASAGADKHWFVYKWRAEEALRASGITHVIIRPTWVYGPDDVALNRFLGFANMLPFVPTFGDGKQLMQPVFIDDLSRVIADAATKTEADNQTFDIGGPERISMDDVVKTALEVAGKKKPILHQPIAVGKLIGSVLQLLPSPPLTADSIDFITHDAVADNSAVERVFAPKLTPLRVGLATYIGETR